MTPTDEPHPVSRKRKPAFIPAIAPDDLLVGWRDAVEFEAGRLCVPGEWPTGLPPATHLLVYFEEGRAVNCTNLSPRVEPAPGAGTSGLSAFAPFRSPARRHGRRMPR
jgi:hypothetical protein